MVTALPDSPLRKGPIRRTPLTALSDQRVRYVLVGGLNTAFGTVAFVGLHFTAEHAIGYLAILTIAWVIAVFEAFLAYRYLVFRVRGIFLIDLARFSLVYAVMFAVNLVTLPLLVEVARLPVLLAQAVAVVPTVLLSYVFHQRFSFRRAPEMPS